jgi:hypothetical protein
MGGGVEPSDLSLPGGVGDRLDASWNEFLEVDVNDMFRSAVSQKRLQTGGLSPSCSGGDPMHTFCPCSSACPIRVRGVDEPGTESLAGMQSHRSDPTFLDCHPTSFKCDCIAEYEGRIHGSFRMIRSGLNVSNFHECNQKS